jgi:3-oxoadipate enol-lactonase
MPPLQEHLTPVRGTTLAWTEEGEGSTVVWAHGLSTSRDAQEASRMFDWSPVVRSGHRLVRYDARGHGHSTATSSPDDYEWRHLAEDLLALLDEVAPGERVAGIGSSMGTATLLHAAVLDPARFSKLVLTSAPTAWQTRAAQAGTYLQTADLIEQQGLAAFEGMMKDAPQPAVFAEVLDLADGLGVTAETAPTIFRGAARSDLPDAAAIASITVPTLLLSWAGDPGHPVVTGSLLAELLPDAALRVAATPAQLAQWGDYAAQFLNEAAR